MNTNTTTVATTAIKDIINKELDLLAVSEIDSHVKAQLFGCLYVSLHLAEEDIDIYQLSLSVALWCFGQKLSGRTYARFFYPEDGEYYLQFWYSCEQLESKIEAPGSTEIAASSEFNLEDI